MLTFSVWLTVGFVGFVLRFQRLWRWCKVQAAANGKNHERPMHADAAASPFLLLLLLIGNSMKQGAAVVMFTEYKNDLLMDWRWNRGFTSISAKRSHNAWQMVNEPLTDFQTDRSHWFLNTCASDRLIKANHLREKHQACLQNNYSTCKTMAWEGKQNAFWKIQATVRWPSMTIWLMVTTCWQQVVALLLKLHRYFSIYSKMSRMTAQLKAAATLVCKKAPRTSGDGQQPQHARLF